MVFYNLTFLSKIFSQLCTYSKSLNSSRKAEAFSYDTRFMSGLFQSILFSSSASQENSTASSEYSSNSNSRASWRKQKTRHVKLQGIGLAGYFCTLMMRGLCVLYTGGFFFLQSRDNKREKRQKIKDKLTQDILQ